MGPALPLWAVVPPAALLLLVLAAYAQALRRATMDEKRRRIRTAGTLVMMAIVPLTVYLFGIATPSRVRPLVFTWALVMVLLVILIVLAVMDTANNVRLARRQRRELRQELQKMRELLAQRPGLRLTEDHGPADGAGER
jgi:peptidoglycan/LPS O-acetylase OafA/YrhL